MPLINVRYNADGSWSWIVYADGDAYENGATDEPSEVSPTFPTRDSAVESARLRAAKQPGIIRWAGI